MKLKIGMMLAIALMLAMTGIANATYWTQWLNRDMPGGTGDWETRFGFTDACPSPIGVECQTVDGVDYVQAGQAVTCDPMFGFACDNSKNNWDCLDYKVRFLCPDSIPITTGNEVSIAASQSTVTAGTPVTISWRSAMADCVLSSTPYIEAWNQNHGADGSITVPVSQASTFTVACFNKLGNGVSDAAGAKAKQVTINIAAPPVNQPPVINSDTGPASIAAQQDGTWAAGAYDPEGNALAYSFNFGDGTSTQYSSSSSATHRYDRDGAYTIIVTAKDDKGATSSSALGVTVTTGTAQMCTGYTKISARSSISASIYTVQLESVIAPSATSPATVTVTLIQNGIGGIATISQIAQGGSYTYTAQNGDLIRISVCYADASSQSAYMAIGVSAASNQPPVITSVNGPSSIAAQQDGTWTVSAYDPEGNAITYSFDFGDRTVAGPSSSNSATHRYDRSGTYTITATAKDDKGLLSSVNLAVTVASSAGTQPPSILLGSLPQGIVVGDSIAVTSKITSNSISGGKTRFKVVTRLSDVSAVGLAAKLDASVANQAGCKSGDIGCPSGFQEKTEYAELRGSESATVVAYFTASTKGIKKATVEVYEPTGGCVGGNCPETYRLVASSFGYLKVSEKSQPPNPPADKFTLNLKSGWNMVSNPSKDSIKVADIANACGTTTYAWKLTSNGYVKATSLESGVGYWLKGTRNCDYTLSIGSYGTEIANLFSGWNLVGAPGKGTALSDVAGNCAITAGPWHYTGDSSNPYAYSANLDEGKAYWIKVSSACALSGSAPPQPPQ